MMRIKKGFSAESIKVMLKSKSINRLTLLIFAIVLILIGLLGFVLPENLVSAAPAYNIFHLIWGFIGLFCAKRENLARGFNISFGLIDLYQFVASFLGWFPAALFQWKTADDILHVIIGGALLLIGIFGKSKTSDQR